MCKNNNSKFIYNIYSFSFPDNEKLLTGYVSRMFHSLNKTQATQLDKQCSNRVTNSDIYLFNTQNKSTWNLHYVFKCVHFS